MQQLERSCIQQKWWGWENGGPDGAKTAAGLQATLGSPENPLKKWRPAWEAKGSHGGGACSGDESCVIASPHRVEETSAQLDAKRVQKLFRRLPVFHAAALCLLKRIAQRPILHAVEQK